MNKLYLGDNLDTLRNIKDESVDLICTDPPFNSGPNYKKSLEVSSTKIEGFTNIWIGTKQQKTHELTLKSDLRVVKSIRHSINASVDTICC